MPDEHGYPTDEELAPIKDWDVVKGDVLDLIDHVKEIWWQRGWGVTHEGEMLELHTGGWSGNEDIIGELRRNTMFWILYWQKSVRGGHYYFDLSRYRKAKSGYEDD